MAELLRVQPGSSRWLAWYLWGVYTAGMGALAYALPPAWALPAMLTLAWMGWRDYRRQIVRRGPRVLLSATLEPAGGWVLEWSEGCSMSPAHLHPATRYFRNWILLIFQDADARLPVLLVTRDNLDAETFRQLHRYLLAWRPA